MLTVSENDANRWTSWWKSYINFKYIIFDEEVVLEIIFNVGRVEMFVTVILSEPGDHNFPNLLLY